MFYFRKQFNNAWGLYRLGSEEVAQTEDLTIDYGMKILVKIRKRAELRKVKLGLVGTFFMLLWYALKYESFASDYIEAQQLQKMKDQKTAAQDGQAAQPEYRR